MSQRRAVAAQASGHFDREIVPVDVPEARDDDGNVTAEARTVATDDGPRAGTTMEVLAQPEARVPARAGRSPPATPAR